MPVELVLRVEMDFVSRKGAVEDWSAEGDVDGACDMYEGGRPLSSEYESLAAGVMRV